MDDPRQPAPPAEGLPTPESVTANILIVDDDARNIFALTSVLENHDVDVISATNGRQAIDIIKSTPGLEMVLMDIMMPEMDG